MEKDSEQLPSESEAETTEEETDEEHITGHDEGDNVQDGSKKKKKKKKKKKRSSPDAAGAGASEESAAFEKAVDKQEAERRFQKALDSAKHSEDMWVLLANANIHDAKARKLFEALKNNSSITSVNLSANYIGDEGVQALVDVLQDGGASELINVDLRGNQLSEHAQQLLGDLKKKRKQLVIETGPLPDESAESSSTSASSSNSSSKPGRGRGRAAAAKQKQQQQQQQQEKEQWDGQSLRDLVKHSAMFRQYFQTEEDEGGVAASSELEEGEELPAPDEVWDQVTTLLPDGLASIPQLGEALLVVSKALEAEMGNMPAAGDRAEVQDFRPHFRAVLEHLGLLQQVLQLEPEAKVHQSSSTIAQPAVGSHRVWACAILHMLLLHNNPIIDKAVAEEKLLPAAVALSLAHERCSAVQCRVVEMLRSSLLSSVQELWQGLFKPGFDCDITLHGSKELVLPLHEALVQIADQAVQQPMGKRSPVVGFVAELANTLIQTSDTSNQDIHCAALAAILQSHDGWQGSIEQQGSLHALLQEQDGQLCGPPPPRPAPSVDEDESSADQSLGIINGSRLMALLSRMGDLSAS